MPKSKAHLRSSRRIPPLRDEEIDHEIDLVDHYSPAKDTRPLSTATINTADISASGQPLIRPESTTSDQRTEEDDVPPTSSHEVEDEAGPSQAEQTTQITTNGAADRSEHASETGGQVTDGRKSLSRTSSKAKRLSQRTRRPSKEPETDIDVLYENERGGFLCGIPLFSSAALGNLDPPAWTNFAHKPSPTNIRNAQVPDPSWEWVWPEWRVNRDDTIQTDQDGWEYSFMFARKFSWHGPRWWNSFVRRRAWIRRRVKKGLGYQANDPHLMNPDYFTVTPAKGLQHGSVAITDDIDRTSVTQKSKKSGEDSRPSREIKCDNEDHLAEIPAELETAEVLMPVLKKLRIDREKLEAVENYIRNCTDDLVQLQEYMHDIMAIFVFQASRKILLSRLIELHDKEARHQTKEKSSARENKKAKNLAEAIKHADEEVRRLEYWSDIKGMAEDGETGSATDCNKGWDKRWEGLDQSGARGVRKTEDLP